MFRKIIAFALPYIWNFLQKTLDKKNMKEDNNDALIHEASAERVIPNHNTPIERQHSADVGFKKPSRKVSRVFIHCTASNRPEHDNIDVIEEWHRARKFGQNIPENERRVGYHYLINKNGNLQIGRDLKYIPTAQAGDNTGTIAIALHGRNNEDFTQEQFTTLKALCKAINNAYEGNITFHGHCEVSNKTCPVFDYKTVLSLNDGKLGTDSEA